MAPCVLFGQQSTPEVSLDKDEILIGQQAHIELRVKYRVDNGASVAIGWPGISDTLTGKIDVVRDSGIDTVLPDKSGDPYLFEQVRSLTITSWDSGFWAIPPFRFTIDGDTLETKALLLTVNTVQVDTSAAFKDIKEIYEVPYGWMDWLREHWVWVAGGALAAGTIAALIVFLVRRSRKRGVPEAPPAPAKPLHERALLALQDIEKKKLWQQGLVKQYHSEVTDVLRAYLEERFEVPALESTTDELLASLRMNAMPMSQQEHLGNLLRMADMVKFAKWTPLPTENEQLLAGAIKLVQQTTGHVGTDIHQSDARTA